MPRFFIDRPIFAWVIALFILVLGGVAVTRLPVSQYPSVAPPAIVISATYPGASAQTLENSVISVIEQEMNGSPGLIYMESISQANGSGSITLTFEAGTDAALAQVDVQNRLSRATPRLPAAVTQQGVRVDKARSNFLLFTILSSDDPAYDPVALGDFASRNVLPEIQRLPGVGQAQLFGTERAMRIWIDPAKLVGFGLTPIDVNNAIRAQNAQVSSGSIGDLPNIEGQGMYATVVVSGQLTTVEQFGNIVLRANTDGSSVKMRDVARIELGGQGYGTSARLNGKPSTGIGVQLTPTGNALATATLVRHGGFRQALCVQIESGADHQWLAAAADQAGQLRDHPVGEKAGPRRAVGAHHARACPRGRQPGVEIDIAGLFHRLQHHLGAGLAGIGIGQWIVAGRRLQAAGQDRRLGQAKLAGMFAEEFFRCRFQAIHAGAEIDLVEIKAEDLVLAVARLQIDGERRFLQLALHGAAGRQEQILGQLLGDGRTALHHAAGHHVAHRGARQAERIDADMRAEAAVLDGDEGIDDIVGQVGRIHAFAPGEAAPSHQAAARIQDRDVLRWAFRHQVAHIGHAREEMREDHRAEDQAPDGEHHDHIGPAALAADDGFGRCGRLIHRRGALAARLAIPAGFSGSRHAGSGRARLVNSR